VELYDKYFGNGGWMPTEVESGRHHHDDACAKRLAVRAVALEQQVLTLRARCVRLAKTIEANWEEPLPHEEHLMPGDLATSYPELPEQGEGGG
jgi:hypothetical protein